MKKLMLTIAVLFMATLFVQANDKYNQAMKTNIAALEKSMNVDELKALQNTFERIGSKEKGEWLPNYYAAYALIKQTWFLKEGEGENIDAMMDKADAYMANAEAAAGEPVADLLLMKSMIVSTRIMVNPMERGRDLGQKSGDFIRQAADLEPNNPRVYLLTAQSLYYTPEMFGGDKKKAKELFEKTISLAKEYVPKSELHPTWGASTAEYFLSQYDKK